MGICSKKDADIAFITEGKDKLKSLMNGGIAALNDMESAQKDLKEGFDSLIEKASAELPEALNLQKELLSLTTVNNPGEFAKIISEIKSNFGEAVGDLDEQLSKISPSMGGGISDLLSGGIPSISFSSICENLPDIEVKEQEITDPTTGKTEIKKVKDVIPEEPIVPKEVPEASEPAPSTDTTEIEAYDNAFMVYMAAKGTVEDRIKKTLTDYDVMIPSVYEAFHWSFRNAIYGKCGRDLDNDANNFTWETGLRFIKIDAEKFYKVFKSALKAKSGSDTAFATIDDRTEIMWANLAKYYIHYEKEYGVVTKPYDGEQGLIAWCNKWFDNIDAKQETPQKKQEEFKKVAEQEAPVLVEPSPDPVPAPLTGIQTKVYLGNKITYNADTVTTKADSATYKVKSTKTWFRAYSQIEYDTMLRVAQTHQSELATFPARIGSTEVVIMYKHKRRNSISRMTIDRYGLNPRAEINWNEKKNSPPFKSRLSELGVKVDYSSGSGVYSL